MPKPDANGTLTVDFKSKFFDDAVHQPNLKKLVINHQGKADVHVEVEPDGKGGQAFWAVVDEPGVKPQDKKKFILPPDVDYITINQQKMDAQNKPVFDDKTKAPVYDQPTDRIAGQLRLQGFRNYFEAPSGGNYGGSSTVPLLRGLTSPDAPANAGQTGVDDFIKYSDHIPSAFLAQVDQQLRHDATVTNSKGVKEGTDEPWFEIMEAQVNTLQAGQELALAKGDGNPDKNQVALDRSTHEAAVIQKLTLADQDYQAAMTAVNTHLSDDAKNPHLPTNGVVPR
jgi:hypothetical protein